MIERILGRETNGFLYLLLGFGQLALLGQAVALPGMRFRLGRFG
jgi:hypothetical protein